MRIFFLFYFEKSIVPPPVKAGTLKSYKLTADIKKMDRMAERNIMIKFYVNGKVIIIIQILY